MKYIERSLGQGEAIVDKAHFHWWYTFKALVLLSLFVIPAIGFIYLLERSNTGSDKLDPIATGLITAAIALPGVWIFLGRMIRKWMTEIAVTSHRFVIKTGLLRLDTNEISLPNIEGVRVKQNLWGRILGYGRLVVEGTGVDNVEIPDIADPVGFRRALETAKYGGNPPPQTHA